MNARDKEEFKGYLHQCTDAQVLGVYEKEFSAGREDYATLAELEADRRGLEVKQ